MILFEGLALGLAYAMPIGSQNIFVIKRALTDKMPKPYITSAFVTFADCSLSVSLIFGLGRILNHWPSLRAIVTLMGAAYLIFLGIQFILKKSEDFKLGEKAILPNHKTLGTAFFLTWANPHAWIDGSVLFGGYRASMESTEIIPFIFGVCLGSALWFFGLTTLVGLTRTKLTPKYFVVLNWISGALMLFLGFKLIKDFIGSVL